MPTSSCRLRNLLITFALLLTGTLPAAAQAATTPITLGVNIDNAPDQLTQLQSYAQVAGGVKPAIVMWYQAWSEPLYYSVQEANMQAFGGVPMITWDPIVNGAGVPLSDIVAGKYDSYILASAQAAKAWGSLMYIRLAHEMNLAGSPFGPGQNGNTAAEYVAAWRHVVTIFRQAGATNVEWVWSPNVDCGGACPFTSFYPGDAWVDWVALDGYNYAGVDGVPWWTFSQVFGPSITSMEGLTSRPLMIAETASSNLGGSQADWITQAFLQQIPSLYPSVRAAIWFDRQKETDWRVNSSAATQAAWDAVVSSPQYQGTAATLQSIAPLSTDVTTGTSTSTGSTGSGSTGSGSTGSGSTGSGTGSTGSGSSGTGTGSTGTGSGSTGTGSTGSGSTGTGSTGTGSTGKGSSGSGTGSTGSTGSGSSGTGRTGSGSTGSGSSGKPNHGGSSGHAVRLVVRSHRGTNARACARHRRHHRRACRAHHRRHHRRNRHQRHRRRQHQLRHAQLAHLTAVFKHPF